MPGFGKEGSFQLGPLTGGFMCFWGVVVVEAICNNCGIFACSAKLDANVTLGCIEFVIIVVVVPFNRFVAVKKVIMCLLVDFIRRFW